MLLLDTCTFLWWATDSASIPEAVRERLRDPNEQVFLSSVSSWEICVKHALGKLSLPVSPRDYVPDRRRRLAIEPLPLNEAGALAISKLPPIHRDPFDRMLVAQAISQELCIVTPDMAIRGYPCLTWWG